jgi:DNA primase
MLDTKAGWVDFKGIKARVSIVQILERYDALAALTKSGSGDRLSGACPIHGGTNKSHFRVSVAKNCWNCFGKCQCGGNVVDFVSKKEGVSFREAALLIQDWFVGESPLPAVPIEKPLFDTSRLEGAVRMLAAEVPAEPAEPPRDNERNKPLAFSLTRLDPSHSYLAERGLTTETIAEFGVGYCSKGLLTGYIAIPIHNPAGELVAYAGRWPGKPEEGKGKYKLPQAFRKGLELFNIHRALRAPAEQPLVVVEGFFDCFALWYHGIRRVVALMGSTLSAAQEELILRASDASSRVVLVLDEDDAGRAGREEIARRLAPHVFVKIFRFEQEGQQPDQLMAEQLAALRL